MQEWADRTRNAWALVIAGMVMACTPQGGTQSPMAAVPEPVAMAPEEPEPEPPPPPKVPADAMAVGTFNLQWAFDSIEPSRRPKIAQGSAARTEEDWAWKRDRIAEILVEEKLDIVALQELGGERELLDITSSVLVKGGYDYQVAWQPSTDHYTGQQVAILSRYPIREVRRYDFAVTKHVAADVELPHGDLLTVVAVHLRGGQYASQEAGRSKQARALKRQVSALQKDHPVLVLGTFNSRALPYEVRYREYAPGILAGAHTRGVEADDCMDSGDEGTAQRTTIEGEPLDRIFSCGLRIRRAEVAAVDKIQRDARDPSALAWSEIPVENAPYRDVSDHYVLWAEVELPKREVARSLADPWAETATGTSASGAVSRSAY